jgi:hypothetical protein
MTPSSFVSTSLLRKAESLMPILEDSPRSSAPSPPRTPPPLMPPVEASIDDLLKKLEVELVAMEPNFPTQKRESRYADEEVMGFGLGMTSSGQMFRRTFECERSARIWVYCKAIMDLQNFVEQADGRLEEEEEKQQGEEGPASPGSSKASPPSSQPLLPSSQQRLAAVPWLSNQPNEFSFTSVQVNKRTPHCPPVHFHKHPENKGESYIVTLGDFHDKQEEHGGARGASGGGGGGRGGGRGGGEGLVGTRGQFMMGGEADRKLVDVYRRLFKFDGKNCAHAPAPHSHGTRYSVVWYTHEGNWEQKKKRQRED